MNFWQVLEKKGETPAIIAENTVISYANLAIYADDFVAALRKDLPTFLSRPLVLLEAKNDLNSCIAYIGALRAGWPVILAGEDTHRSFPELLKKYRPNLLIHDGQTEILHTSQIEMHPDLALLLSTSGTTGAAKLVRLSAENIQSNAESICSYLDITSTDCSMTTLPLHYSYGMSVLHSYLIAGATLVLTNLSVSEPEFWALARSWRVTALAFVPTQYEILEKGNFSKVWLPTLRYMTQAGGKLDPNIAVHFATQAQKDNWQLFIMYGQTEAAPRISYVPPQDAGLYYRSIGRAIPGGRIYIVDYSGQPIDDPSQTGELVYEGPNVMMGYAHSSAELAYPAGPARLMTGDIGRQLENGYFEITGRASRFVKLFGLRIGLDEIEQTLRREGSRVFASGSDRGLVLFLADHSTTPTALRRHTADRFKLPEAAIVVTMLEAVPLLSTGKIDYRTLALQAEALLALPQSRFDDLKSLLCRVLHTDTLQLDKSFLDMGGDSLSYLEVQIYLARIHGSVPAGWEQLSLDTLLQLDSPSQSSQTTGRIDISADLIARLLALLAVIALHSTAWPLAGGAYLLLILSGYSLARFQSASLFNGQPLKMLRAMLLPLLSCYFVLLTAMALFWKHVDLSWFVLLGNFDTQVTNKGLIPYWFVCTYAQLMLLICLPFLVPALRLQIRNAPYHAALLGLMIVMLCVSLFGLDRTPFPVRHHNPLTALELFLLGWCMFFAQETKMRVAVTAIFFAIYALHWSDAPPSAVVLIVGGTLSVLWGGHLRLPYGVSHALMLMGSLTLFTYLAHPPILSFVSKGPETSDVTRFILVSSISFLSAFVLKQGYEQISATLKTVWNLLRKYP